MMAGALNDAVRCLGRVTILSRHFGKLLKAYITIVGKRKRPVYDLRRKTSVLAHDLKVERARFTLSKQAWEAEKAHLLGVISELEAGRES